MFYTQEEWKIKEFREGIKHIKHRANRESVHTAG